MTEAVTALRVLFSISVFLAPRSTRTACADGDRDTGLQISASAMYLGAMRQYEYQPCIPTRGTKVPAGPEWLHEIKHDGYRLIVQRDGARVRLFTRNGHDWTARYPLVVEAALRSRAISSFVIDGEAVLLGVDCISDFNGLHSRRRELCTLERRFIEFTARMSQKLLGRRFPAVSE
jgi:ATP-dependent DNA ligase